jgi:hypothetical protein
MNDDARNRMLMQVLRAKRIEEVGLHSDEGMRLAWRMIYEMPPTCIYADLDLWQDILESLEEIK